MLYSKTKIGDELEKACTEWGKMMQESLDERFGKNRAAYCLVLTTVGKGGSFHMNTNLKREGMAAFFKEIADRLRGITVH